MMRRHGTARGFTLMELLVAVALFAVVSAVAYAGLRAAMTTRQAAELHAERIAELQRAFAQLALDLSQLADRPGRDAQGQTDAAFELTGTGALPSLELVRGGRTNPAGLPRSNLQRIEYRRVEDRLERLAWSNLDRVQGETPNARVLLAGVTGVAWRFVDGDGAWHEAWPPVRRSAAVAGVPAGVELVLGTDQGDIRRLFTTGVGS